MDLVFLHGAAASGKLTTAEVLHDRLGYPVFHNHLVVDLLTAVFPFGSEPFVRLREQFWLAVVSDAARAGRSLTFTFTPETSVQIGFPDRVHQAVTAAGGRVCFVHLAVSDVEQEQRIGAQSRTRFHKLTDVETLRCLRSHPGQVEAPPVDLHIDTDNSGPGESATTIIERFGLLPQPLVQRYPT